MSDDLMARWLIVNADDFGQSAGVNRGILEAHQRGIVTAASLMVRWPEAVAAARYGGLHPAFDLGLHLDLGEWCYEEGDWKPRYHVVALQDALAVAREVRAQVDRFRDLTGHTPTHLDSHQHVHLREPVRSIMRTLAGELGVPLRSLSDTVRYCGGFYGQTAEGQPYPESITVCGLLRILDALGPGVSELGCHPGYAPDLETTYRKERTSEVATLCDPRVRAALASRGIGLTSFAALNADHRVRRARPAM